MNKKYKSILFDYDDTLVQTRKIRYKTIKRIGKELYNYNFIDDEIDSAWGLPADNFLIKLFGKFSSDLNYIWEIYNKYKKEDLNIPHHNAFTFIKNHKNIFHFGIVTSSSSKIVHKELEEMNFDRNLFFEIQGSEATTVHKPDPKVFIPIYNILLEKEIFKNEILYIGDSPADFYSATKFGFDFIGITHDSKYENFFKENNTRYAKSFNEIEQILIL